MIQQQMNITSDFTTTNTTLEDLQKELVNAFEVCRFEPMGALYENWMDAEFAMKKCEGSEEAEMRLVDARSVFVNQCEWTCSAYDATVCVFDSAISVFTITIVPSNGGHVVEIRRLDGCKFAFSAVLAKLSAHFKIIIPGIIPGIDYK